MLDSRWKNGTVISVCRSGRKAVHSLIHILFQFHAADLPEDRLQCRNNGLTLRGTSANKVQHHNACQQTNKQWKKCSERRKHCALAVVRRRQKFSPGAASLRRKESALAVVSVGKNFAPPDPLPGGTGRPKFNQLEMVTTFTYKTSLVRIDEHNFELSW